MYKFIIGIDVSKRTIDVSYYGELEPCYLGSFKNEIAGFKKMKTQLKKLTNEPLRHWFVCFENTGSYSKHLLEWLCSQGIDRLEENPLQIKKSLGIRRGTTDKIASKDICNYAHEKRGKLNPTTLVSPVISKLRKLISYRSILVRKRQAMSICVKEEMTLIDKDTIDFLENSTQKIVDMLSDKIKETENKILEIIESDEAINHNYKLVKSVVGVGFVTAVMVICITNNFKDYTTARKLCNNAGIAPHPNQSGIKSRKNRISKIGNRKLKALLSNNANSAIKHDHALRAYYERKMAEGKEYSQVINAVKNKIVQRIYSVVNRGTPYVNLKQYA